MDQQAAMRIYGLVGEIVPNVIRERGDSLIALAWILPKRLVYDSPKITEWKECRLSFAKREDDITRTGDSFSAVGWRPDRSRYNNTPSAYRSVAVVMAPAITCSGAAYSGVRATVPLAPAGRS